MDVSPDAPSGTPPQRAADPNQGGPGRWAVGLVCVLLVAAVALVYGQTLGFEFVNFDDNHYVYNNPHVTHGINGPDLYWALTHCHGGHWHPLTWLSHMLDCQLYGLHPWGHHLTNVALHALAAVLLFLVLRSMTGALGPSALVAAVFAVHPLHVENVAWIADRKDLLCGVFFMLTLAAYVALRSRPFAWRRYLVLLACFGLGLTAKSMLVTLPCVLLLLDYWPLGRWPGGPPPATVKTVCPKNSPLLFSLARRRERGGG